MTIIESRLSDEEYKKVCAFLAHVKALLATHQFTVDMEREKNKTFSREYGIGQEGKERILQCIKPEDCYKISPNNNYRYPESEVYVFIPTVELVKRGDSEATKVRLYVKEYIRVNKLGEQLIVISFHEEGEYD